MKNKAVTIKLFLVHGDPDGLRTAEISNWSGKALAGPRSEIGSFLKREEISSPGVYFLAGVDPETDQPSLYIGEAENVKNRIRQHQSKDDWSQAIAFNSKDENLTKSHIRYLEGELISRVKEAGSIFVRNETSSGAKLPESDQADMDAYLSNILSLLPVLGVDFFAKPEIKEDDPDMLFCSIKGLTAQGKRTPSGFVVFAGSQAVKDHRPSAKRSAKKRNALLKEGTLRDEGDHLVFTQNYEVGSSSTAGSIVKGGSTNGLIAWKNRAGKTLKEIEDVA